MFNITKHSPNVGEGVDDLQPWIPNAWRLEEAIFPTKRDIFYFY